MKNCTLLIVIAALLAFTVPSYAGGVGVTGYSWLKMPKENQRAYVEGVLDGFVYSFGLTGNRDLLWSKKYTSVEMDWNRFMAIIKKHFDSHPDQLHNVMVAIIKDALENGIPDEEDFYEEDDDRRGGNEVPIMEDR